MDANTLLVSVRLSVNLTAMTIEQVFILYTLYFVNLTAMTIEQVFTTRV